MALLRFSEPSSSICSLYDDLFVWLLPSKWTTCIVGLDAAAQIFYAICNQGEYGPWWCHQMETFSALLALFAGNSPVTGEFPAQRPVTWSFDIFFDLRLDKRWVNNSEADGLRRHCAHYDVIVMALYRWLNAKLSHQYDFLMGIIINSLRPSDAAMHQQTRPSLVQMMSCHLFGIKPLSEPVVVYCQMDLGNKLQWNFDWNSKVFIEENAHENVVCQMLAILPQPQCINSKWSGDSIWQHRSKLIFAQVMACGLISPR